MVRTYDIRVGRPRRSPWVDYVLNSGPGVMDETNARACKVGTLVVTITPPP